MSLWSSRRKANVWWWYKVGLSVVYCVRCNPGSDNEVAKSRQQGRCKGQQGPGFHLTFRCQGAEFEPFLYLSEGKRASLPLPMSSLRTGWKRCTVKAHERAGTFTAGCTFPWAQEEQSSRAEQVKKSEGAALNIAVNRYCPSDCSSCTGTCKWDKVTSLGASWETNAPPTKLLLLFIAVANLFQKVNGWMNTLVDTYFVGMLSGFHINKIPPNAGQLVTVL